MTTNTNTDEMGVFELLEEIQRLAAEMNAPTLYEIDVTCALCGRREIRSTRDPSAAGAVTGICNRCLDA